MTAITGPVAWICSPATGEITGYRRKVNGVYKDFPFPLPNAAMSLADATLVPQPLWITNSTTGAIEGYRRAIGNLDVDYNAYPGAGTAAGRVTLGVQWLANIATGEIIGYRTTNVDGSITDRSVAFGATLFLDFTNTNTLDPRITFTRSTTATYFNSAGVLTTTGFNLLLHSEQFDNAAWNKSNATVTANAITSPDGMEGADKLVEDTTTSPHYAGQNVTLVSGTAYTYTCYIKAAERAFASLQLGGGGFGNQGVAVNLTTGASTAYNSPTSSSVVNVGNGWWRISLTATASGTAGTPIVLTNNSFNVQTYTGDGTSGVYVWGAQFEVGSVATVYIPTTSATSGAPRFDYDPVTLAPLGLLIEEQRTNLLTYSEMFADAAWTKTNASITANTIVSPDGALTADKLVENTANSSHLVLQTAVITSGTSYTFSIYAKAAERSRILIAAGSTSFTANQAIYDLSNGTTSAVVACTASITSVGNGWYRCSWTATATATASTAFNVLLNIATPGVYPGDGTSGLHIWGAQLEAGAFPTSYIPTAASQVTRAADVAVMTGTNFSSWYNQAEGTLYAEGASVSTSRVVLAVDDGSMPTRYQVSIASSYTPNFAAVSGGAVSADLYAPAPAAGSLVKIAGAYRVNDFALSANGGAATTDTSGALPLSVSTLRLGSWQNGTGFLSGHIRKIVYYPRRLSNAALQGITS